MGHFFSFRVFAMVAASNENVIPCNIFFSFLHLVPATTRLKNNSCQQVLTGQPRKVNVEKDLNLMCKILPGLKAPPWYFLISILDHCCVGSFRVNGKLHGGEQ